MKLAIAAGGTGGHVFPALAVAEECIKRGGDVLIILSGRDTEESIFELKGADFEIVPSGQIAGKGVVHKLRSLVNVLKGIFRSIKLLKREKVNVVLGLGGYGSFPVIVAAFLLRIPRAILEANAVPGLANRALAGLATRIFVNFESVGQRFPKKKVFLTGVPVRKEFISADFGSLKRKEVPLILVTGGSLGARSLNLYVPEALKELWKRGVMFSVLHQCGRGRSKEAEGAYKGAEFSWKVVEFIADMRKALEECDLVISRSGASFLAELAIAGRPAVLVPYPYAAGNHQFYNAMEFERMGAAVVVDEGDDFTGRLAEAVMHFLVNEDARLEAARSAKELARKDAAGEIVSRLEELV